MFYKIFLVLIMCFLFNNLFARNTLHYPRNSVYHSANIKYSFSYMYKKLSPINLQLGLDTSFSKEEEAIIYNAVEIYVKRALSKRVIDCAYRRSSKDLPKSRQIFEAKVYDSMRPLIDKQTVYPSFSFIARYWNDDISLGTAYVNLFYDKDIPFPGTDHRHYLHIALNSDFLGPDSYYYLSTDADYWAGVIGHEFLHNLGYEHPTGYPGSFINEYGDCLYNNGLDMKYVKGQKKPVMKDIVIYKK